MRQGFIWNKTGICEKIAWKTNSRHKGKIVPELRYYGILVYRELTSSPWRIIYKVEELKVWVLAVIDGRRNMEDILLDRFI